jgi:hypothetical protein
VRQKPTGSLCGARLGHYVLGFSQDLAGEIYVLTTDNTGPTGNTGKVYKIIPPATADRTSCLVGEEQAGPRSAAARTARACHDQEFLHHRLVTRMAAADRGRPRTRSRRPAAPRHERSKESRDNQRLRPSAGGPHRTSTRRRQPQWVTRSVIGQIRLPGKRLVSRRDRISACNEAPSAPGGSEVRLLGVARLTTTKPWGGGFRRRSAKPLVPLDGWRSSRRYCPSRRPNTQDG